MTKIQKTKMSKHEFMTQTPVGKLVVILGIPAIATMLITSVYNMADTFFVGLIGDGTIGTSAVSIVFSYMSILQAIGFFFGHGSGNLISRLLGRQKNEEASVMASVGFFLAFGIGALLLIFGMIFLEPFAKLLQANPDNMEEVKSYLFYILLGSPFIVSSFVLNNQLRFQGSAYYGMVGIGIGAVLNIALDPLFIFTLDMGVGGAGLATSISQIVSFCVLLFMGTRGENIRLRLKNFKPTGAHLVEIVKGGTPSLLRQGLAAVAVMCLNGVAFAISEDNTLVAAMGVSSRIMHFIFSTLLGFGQGFQPLCGYNYGAKRYDRVKAAFWFCIKWCTVVVVVASVLGFIFAPQLASLLNQNEAVYTAAGTALRHQFVVFPLLPFTVLTNMILQNLSRVYGASVLALMRQGAAYIPLLYVMQPFGEFGLFLVQPIADVVAFAVAVPLAVRLLKELTSKQLAVEQEVSDGEMPATGETCLTNDEQM